MCGFSEPPTEFAVASPATQVQADFDRIALLSTDAWDHNSHTRAAWDEHGRHDSYLTLSEIRKTCADVLPGASVKRHLLWRYSLIWKKE